MTATAAVKSTPKTIALTQVDQPGGSRKFEATCSNCKMHETCLPGGVLLGDLERVRNLVYSRRRVRRGEMLFTAGDAFRSIYGIRSGFFKTTVIDDEGREQVTGFSMGGDLLGMAGFGSGRYPGNAIALEDSEVCIMPLLLVEDVAREVPGLQRRLNALLASEIVRDHGVMMLLGSLRAEERLATFLVNLARRFAQRGYSATEFHLRMTREEIGSYLGLKLETVSRLFSQFQRDGVIEVNQKHVRILDAAALESLRAGAA